MWRTIKSRGRNVHKPSIPQHGGRQALCKFVKPPTLLWLQSLRGEWESYYKKYLSQLFLAKVYKNQFFFTLAKNICYIDSYFGALTLPLRLCHCKGVQGLTKLRIACLPLCWGMDPSWGWHQVGRSTLIPFSPPGSPAISCLSVESYSACMTHLTEIFPPRQQF